MNYFMRVSPYKKNQKYEKSVFSSYFLDLKYCFTHFALVLQSLWRSVDVADIDYFFQLCEPYFGIHFLNISYPYSCFGRCVFTYFNANYVLVCVFEIGKVSYKQPVTSSWLLVLRKVSYQQPATCHQEKLATSTQLLVTGYLT